MIYSIICASIKIEYLLPDKMSYCEVRLAIWFKCFIEVVVELPVVLHTYLIE